MSLAVALGVLISRHREPDLTPPFRTTAIWFVGPLVLASCGFLLWSLPQRTKILFSLRTLAGSVVYALYEYRKSPLRLWALLAVHDGLASGAVASRRQLLCAQWLPQLPATATPQYEAAAFMTQPPR